MIEAVYFAIGNELLNGKILDRNGQFLARKLSELGVSLKRVVFLPDEVETIVDHLKQTKQNLIFTSGGLGPTPDDVTCDALAKWLGKGMSVDKKAQKKIIARLSTKGIDPQPALKQAEYPVGFQTLDNRHGLAPILFHSGDKKKVICLPGVPYEFSGNLVDQVLPRLKKTISLSAIHHTNLVFTGLRESDAAEEIKKMRIPKGIGLAFLPSLYGLTIRLSGTDIELHRSLSTKLKKVFKDNWISSKGEQLHEVIHRLLIKKKLKLAMAESCTGGKLTSKMVSLTGASRYLDSGVVSYANEAKIKWLGVKEKDLSEHGAVSEKVALAMVSGLAKKRGVDIALSTTGVAGPDGGSKEKPVGTVWVGIYCEGKSIAKSFYFPGTREQVQERTVAAALHLLHKQLTYQK